MRYSGVDYLKPLTPYLALLATPVTFRPEMVVSPSPRLSRSCTGHNPADPIVTGMLRAGKLQLSCKTQDHTLATKDLCEGGKFKEVLSLLSLSFLLLPYEQQLWGLKGPPFTAQDGSVAIGSKIQECYAK